MKKIILRGRKVVGGSAEGEAMVTKTPLGGWGALDPMTGTILERRHELRGRSFKGKVLVIPSAKGSSGFSLTYHTARLAGSAPRAVIMKDINSLAALATVVMHTPTVTDLDKNPVEVIETGDYVKVDADKGIVEVTRK